MEHDLKMFSFYFEDKKEGNNIELPVFKTSKDFEMRIPACALNPTEGLDYPKFDDYEEDFGSIIEKKYGEEWCDYMSDNLSAQFGNKRA